MALLLSGASAAAQEEYLDNANMARWLSDPYAYMSTEGSKKRSEEIWLLTLHLYGSRTLRATNSYDQYMEIF
jgi:hypothetical protein